MYNNETFTSTNKTNIQFNQNQKVLLARNEELLRKMSINIDLSTEGFEQILAVLYDNYQYFDIHVANTITSVTLNTMKKLGDNKGISIAFYLAGNEIGLKTLSDNDYRIAKLIDAETLNAIIGTGVNLGDSVALRLSMSVIGCEILCNLANLISAQIVNRHIMNRKSIIFYLSQHEAGCRVLSADNFRITDLIDEWYLNNTMLVGDESAAYNLAKSEAGCEILRANNCRLVKLIPQRKLSEIAGYLMLSKVGCEILNDNESILESIHRYYLHYSLSTILDSYKESNDRLKQAVTFLSSKDFGVELLMDNDYKLIKNINPNVIHDFMFAILESKFNYISLSIKSLLDLEDMSIENYLDATHHNIGMVYARLVDYDRRMISGVVQQQNAFDKNTTLAKIKSRIFELLILSFCKQETPDEFILHTFSRKLPIILEKVFTSYDYNDSIHDKSMLICQICKIVKYMIAMSTIDNKNQVYSILQHLIRVHNVKCAINLSVSNDYLIELIIAFHVRHLDLAVVAAAQNSDSVDNLIARAVVSCEEVISNLHPDDRAPEAVEYKLIDLIDNNMLSINKDVLLEVIDSVVDKYTFHTLDVSLGSELHKSNKLRHSYTL